MDLVKFHFNPIKRLWQLLLGYEIDPIELSSGSPSFTCAAGTYIYKIKVVGGSAGISSATKFTGGTTLGGVTLADDAEINIRLSAITCTSITGAVLLYLKNAKDEPQS